MARQINKNLLCLIDSFYNEKFEGTILEGGSRSGKTWSGVDFVIYLCSKVEKNATIHILRETYNSFKTTLFEDFQRRLPYYQIFDSPFGRYENISRYNLFGTNIHFLGCDKASKTLGSGCDYFWMNEILEINKMVFNQKEQRCRKFWWGDYNPNVTQHWVYDIVDNRNDISFLETTKLDNPFISEKEKKKILSYEPTIENIKNRTADDYMWQVYGIGKRAALTGLIHKNIKYIDKFPNLANWYGLDFGFTNSPSALVRVAIEGKNLYLELLCYEATETPEILDLYLQKINIERSKPIIADSADKYSNEKGSVEMVRDLRKKHWKISKVSKTKSIIYWINKMNEYNIHIVLNNLGHFAKKEAENYKYREINGIAINQPIDAFDHFWNASRYGFMANFQKETFNFQQ